MALLPPKQEIDTVAFKSMWYFSGQYHTDLIAVFSVWELCAPAAELGIIGDNLTNPQRINRSTLSIVSYRLA
jgi:hypothetical protein